MMKAARSEPTLFHRGAVHLDVSPSSRSYVEVLVGRPLEVVAQVVTGNLERAAAVSGQERGRSGLSVVWRPGRSVGADLGGEQCWQVSSSFSWQTTHYVPIPDGCRRLSEA